MMTNTEPTTPPVNGAAPLVRPRAGRVFAGVAAGLADRLDVPAWVIRLVFVVLAFAGGAGFALYLIGWLFIPNEGEEESIAVRTFSRTDGTTSWIGIILIGIAILIAIDSIGFVRGDFAFAVVLVVVGILLYRGDLRGTFHKGDRAETTESTTDDSTRSDSASTPPASVSMSSGVPVVDLRLRNRERPPRPPRRPQHPPSYLGRLTVGLALVTIGAMAFADYLMTTFDPTFRHYMGVAMALAGLGLVVGAWFGRARGLIVVGILLIPPLLVSPFAEFDYDGPIGDRRVAPATVNEMASGYDLAIGQLIVDLRDVDFGDQRVVLDVRVGIGSLQILVPSGVGLDGEARVGIGEIDLPSGQRAGFARIAEFDEAGTGTLVLDARTNLGEVVIRRSGGAAIGATESFGVGDVDIEITSLAQLEDAYDYEAGNVVLDLSAVSLAGVELPRDVRIDLGTGDVTVIVSDADLVDVTAEVGVGRLTLFDQAANGLGLDREFDGTGDAVLSFDINVGAGTLTVEEN